DARFSIAFELVPWPRCFSSSPDVELSGRLRGAGLARLLLKPLAGDADAFLLVRVGWTQPAQIRRYLADLVFVRAAHRQMRLFLDANLDSFRNWVFHWMRKAEREHEVLSLDLASVPDADDVEFLLESFRNAVDRIRHERTRQTVQRALLFALPQRRENSILRFKADSERHAD